MIYLKVISLIVAIWFTFASVGSVYNRQSVPPANIFLLAAGWVAFIFSMGWLTP